MAPLIEENLALESAAAVLAGGGIAAIPTETVYGLAADASNGSAVARIFEAKRRPRFNPLIAHVADIAMAERLAVFDPVSMTLAKSLWPGPLTLVLPRLLDAPVHDLVTAGLETIALRMPKGFGNRLIAKLGRPLAAPSANSSGRISATTAQAVQADLGERIDLIVDGGPTPVGVESTIIKVEGKRIVLLRPGGIPVEDIEKVSGVRVVRDAEGKGVQAPGQLASHYAPRAQVRLDARTVQPGEALLAFGERRAENAANALAVLNLSPRGDLREAAANLFAYMHRLDESGARTIAVEPIPDHGLGEAINDRLRRAAAPRDVPIVNERA
ncbi:MAG: L-threonylcarbamoyladenylate synthase [Rhizobiaceae bacterium]